MWILIRLGASVAAFLFKFIKRRKRWESEVIGDLPVRVSRRQKKGTVLSLEMGVETAYPTTFRIGPERASDRLFKRIGYSTEFQTGDQQFDQRYYITSDDEVLNGLLANSEKARDLVAQLHQHHIECVKGDGKTLWAKKDLPRVMIADVVKLLNAFNALLEPLAADAHVRYDPFYWKAAAVEGAVYSIAAYAYVSLGELIVPPPYHIRHTTIVLYGLAAGALVAAAGAALVYRFMRGSSRGHRLIMESKVVLILSVPLLGIQTVSDLNRKLDRSAPVLFQPAITSKREQKHPSRGRNSRSYHLHFNAPIERQGIELPEEIEVDRDVYESAQAGGILEVEVAPGFLGAPWYRSVRVADSGR